MSEEAAAYRLDIAEANGRAASIEEMYRKVSVEANRLRLRVRELEDAILIHAQQERPSKEADQDLYGHLDELWN